MKRKTTNAGTLPPAGKERRPEQSSGNIKKVPQRTCLACRQVKPKRELIRLVKTGSGSIEIDRTGKAEGRGAYLCMDPACWDKIVRGNALEHAFRSIMKQEDRERLAACGKALLEEISIGKRE